MKTQLALFLFITIFLVIEADKTRPIVKTPLGNIRGIYQQSHNGRKYKSFEGVPYAKPPVGNLRFQPPERFPAWKGDLLAVRPESECLQYAHIPDNPPERVQGSEDCLYLNIYNPSSEESKILLPVIFLIHGGAFQFGSGHGYRPDYIMDRDLIVVTVNYRLGPLGFLSTGDDVVPGNMGLKDQSLALRWVSENIKYFGGDPGKITLAGLSAGGASVHYHYLSPMSRGLFQGGMSFSGTALDCWTQTEDSIEKGKKLGDKLGCPTDNSKIMIECLMTRPAKSIVQLVGDFMPWLYNPYTPFGPVVEKYTSKSFINRSPVDIIESGDAADVPWLTSVTSEEGLYPAAEFVADKVLMAELNDKWNSIAPHLLDYNYTIKVSDHVNIAEKIRKHYLGVEKIDGTMVLPLIHMIGDRLFVVDGEKAARMMAIANKSPVWFYFYSYRAQFSLSDDFIPSRKDFGVSHGDDVFMVVHRHITQKVNEKNDIIIQELLLNIWQSFANTGIPDAGVEWPELNPFSYALEYLHIASSENIKMDKNSNLGDKKFWNSIDFNENKITPGLGKFKDEF
ncbi:hypothetical protein HCN44_007414 [Aphidius gifuensis]|uniref:Carboxylic ester hydrolase n=1 Tax=Aphidius gifuensis TaxID=684658 RepID=A0A835CN39_APHGI|nr:hypothetical protein HCN44_007414 [Aphidius gifuensis]